MLWKWCINDIKMNLWDEKKVIWLFINVSFYNTFLKKHILNALKTDLLHELPFYNKLNIKQESKAFKRYARIYKIEIIDRHDP